LLARTHHGGRGFVTGAFNAEDVSVSHASILVEAGHRNVGRQLWLSRNDWLQKGADAHDEGAAL
jgi:hypothetical protein